MTDYCGTCGVSYTAFRAPGQLDWNEAQQLQWQRSKRNAARGDYSTPATRAAILGKMHEIKLEGWEEHQRLCGEYAALEALYMVDQEELEDRGEWDALDDIQRSIRELESDLGLGPEVPF